jgi:hypothetical protein
MLRSVNQSHLSRLLLAAATLTVLAACEARGIGDPCVPEAIPTGGFDDREVYVETSSVQCRTRTCMVFRLDGNPERIVGTDSCPDGVDCVNPELPVSDQTSLERVFCSCRCSAAGDVNTPLCNCTSGFHCVDVLTAGGVGVQGGYCVPDELCTSDEDCTNDDGTMGSCNPTTGVCG